MFSFLYFTLLLYNHGFAALYQKKSTRVLEAFISSHHRSVSFVREARGADFASIPAKVRRFAGGQGGVADGVPDCGICGEGRAWVMACALFFKFNLKSLFFICS